MKAKLTITLLIVLMVLVAALFGVLIFREQADRTPVAILQPTKTPIITPVPTRTPIVIYIPCPDSSVCPVMPTPAVRTPEPTPITTEEPDPDVTDDPVQGPSGPGRTGSPHTATATPKPTVESGMAFTLTILGKTISVAGNVEASTLDKAPGWLPTSAKPGKEGVCVVYGHRNRNHLLVLKDIDYGDTILVTMPNGKTYTYIVEQTEILDSDDELRIPIIEGKHLILVTCYPFYYSGHAPKQFVATCTIQKNNMSG